MFFNVFEEFGCLLFFNETSIGKCSEYLGTTFKHPGFELGFMTSLPFMTPLQNLPRDRPEQREPTHDRLDFLGFLRVS